MLLYIDSLFKHEMLNPSSNKRNLAFNYILGNVKYCIYYYTLNIIDLN